MSVTTSLPTVTVAVITCVFTDKSVTVILLPVPNVPGLSDVHTIVDETSPSRSSNAVPTNVAVPSAVGEPAAAMMAPFNGAVILTLCTKPSAPKRPFLALILGYMPGIVFLLNICLNSIVFIHLVKTIRILFGTPRMS